MDVGAKITVVAKGMGNMDLTAIQGFKNLHVK
jgi:hypothetical protein